MDTYRETRNSDRALRETTQLLAAETKPALPLKTRRSIDRHFGKSSKAKLIEIEKRLRAKGVVK